MAKHGQYAAIGFVGGMLSRDAAISIGATRPSNNAAEMRAVACTLQLISRWTPACPFTRKYVCVADSKLALGCASATVGVKNHEGLLGAIRALSVVAARGVPFAPSTPARMS
eukprot:6006187-Alexandrium_andersonii.AAC.1